MNRKERRENKNKQTQAEQYKASVIDCSQTFVLKMELPEKVLTNLQAYCQDLINDESAKNASYKLAGQIEKGKELSVDPTDSKVEDFALKVRSLAVSYVNEFATRVPDSGFSQMFNSDGTFDVRSDSMWMNSYEKGDYNPYHDHSTKSPMGLSWFLYIKIPEGMNNYSPSTGKGEKDRANGCTLLQWGYTYQTAADEMRSLVIPPNILINPREGDLYIFPKWMKHEVYPHTCDGDRVSMAGNISIYPSKKSTL